MSLLYSIDFPWVVYWLCIQPAKKTCSSNAKLTRINSGKLAGKIARTNVL